MVEASTTWQTVAVGAVGLANVGAIVYLVKTVIAPVAQTVKAICLNVEELYKSRNDHEVRLAKTETIHQLKGCDLPVMKK
jgi:hypothetical protein